MNVHLYMTSHGRILGVDDCDDARDAVPHARMPRKMFRGRPVPRPVAKAYLDAYGGLWFRHDGLRRVPTPTPAVARPMASDDYQPAGLNHPWPIVTPDTIEAVNQANPD